MTEQEYWTEIRDLAEQVKQECKEYSREVGDVLHEMVDGHQWVIYTRHNYAVLSHSRNDGYTAENFGMDSAVKNGQLNTAALAYGAMYGDLCDELAGWEPSDTEEQE